MDFICVSLVSIELQQDPNLHIIANRKGLCYAFKALRSSNRFLLACCAASATTTAVATLMVDLRSNLMPLEPLHKWLSSLFHGIMVLFECWDAVESHVISSLLFYFRRGFNIIQRSTYIKYKKYRQRSKSIVSCNGRFQKKKRRRTRKRKLTI